MTHPFFPLDEVAAIANWPLVGLLPDGLDKVWVAQPYYDTATQTGRIGVLLENEIELRIPGLDFMSLMIGSVSDAVDFELQVSLTPFEIGVRVPLTLRVDAKVLRPVKAGTISEPDMDAPTLDIVLPSVEFGINGDGDIRLDINGAVTVPRCIVGTTGVVLQIGKLQWVTPASPENNRPLRTPAGFTGLYFDDVTVEVPQLPAAVSGIRMDDVFLGTGGFSGVISKPNLALQWDATKSDFTGAMHGELFGFKGGISSMSIEFRQNALVGCQIAGDIFVPYFNKRVGLTLGLDGAGGLTAVAALPHSSPAETGVTAGSPGYLIHLDAGNILSLDIATLRFNAPAGGVPRLGISGRVAPGSGVLDFPPIQMTGLWIDTRGRIQTEGDGITLPSRYTLNFHGFQLEISKLGFGNSEDGGKWIGFSGGVKLIAAMPAGASVEGLRITWYEDGRIQTTLNGVRVNFEVPNTLKFAGEVSYRSDLQQFRGALKLDLIALKMQVDATAVFGVRDGQTYLALYLAAEFPAGIPLFATGLGVYGMAGLFALNMEPKRTAGQEWYALGSTTDWYHSPPAVGVTSLEKWTPRSGSMAFGAGVTLGTISDNGHTFSGRMLLAIVFPGPILLIQGSASLLQPRTNLDKDANFRALAVLDGRAGTFLLGLDAKYRYDQNGTLIDINGAAEGFFNFNDPKAWRINVGLKEPRERRLTARLFKLFNSYSYVALNAQELAMGAWIGFKQQWQFGPLSVNVEAWIDGNARVSFKPAHFYGDLWLHGSARLAAFGFSVGLTVDARIAADVFDPFHVLGQFRVAIDLPWPLSDIAVDIKLEWGPQPTPPPLPLPLKEIAVEHFKATTSWPLPRVARGATPPLLLPNYDNGDGFFRSTSGHTPPASTLVPVVPLDSRPHITFARNINDDALVGVNAQPVVPEFERIGDPVRNQGPARIRYGLKGVVLEKLKGGSWQGVAGKGRDENDQPINLPATLFGSWAPVPQMPGGGGRNVGQTKLWLWSKTPFEYTRRSSRAWDEWFTDEYSGYPCQTLPGTCWDFEEIPLTSALPNPWHHPAEPELSIRTTHRASITELHRPLRGLTHSFKVELAPPLPQTGPSAPPKSPPTTPLPPPQPVPPPLPEVTINLPQPSNFVRIMMAKLVRVSNAIGLNAKGEAFKGTIVQNVDAIDIEFRGIDIVQLNLDCDRGTPVSIAEGVAAAIGSDYVPSLDQIVFVEFHGKLSKIDLISNEYKVLGTGYTNPEDVVVTASGKVAYVTERSGNLLRVDLSNAERTNAAVVSKDMTAPHQIALDETGGKAYVVEFGGAGRLLKIDLEGATAGKQTVITSGLDQAVGLLVTNDLSTAYVSEQGGVGRLTRVNIATGSREIVTNNLPGIFLLRWANAAQDSILTLLRGEASLIRIDLNNPTPQRIFGNLPSLPSSVVRLPNERYVVCSDRVLSTFSTGVLIPQICDVGGNVLVRHFEDEFARWSQTGEVLEPHTNYRLKVVTTMNVRGEGQLSGYTRNERAVEFAYFRTDGPPGVARLTPPIGSEAVPSSQGSFVSPLDDLSRYVRKTVPRVDAPTPQNPVGSRLLYRAYDVGVEFDENYVDLMYRLGRRDLSIHFHDGNGAICDDEGRRLVLANQWGRAENVTLSEREERWLSVLGASGCTLVDLGAIVKNTTLSAPSEPHVFTASALCEARLIPALLHDDFGGYEANAGANGPGGSFQRWQVRDEAGSVASHWQINSEGTQRDFVLAQTINATTTLVYMNEPELPQDHPEQPANWTSYRLTVHLQFNDGKIGLVWHYRDASNHYRFVMDAQAGKRELIQVSGGAFTVLATKPFTHTPGQGYVIGIEAVDSSFRVYQDGSLVFDETAPMGSGGTIGVHCAGNSSARFTDIYVDDFRSTAPVVYRFSFLTSRFKNFVDHLGSFENKTWRVEVAPTANLAPLIGAAVNFSTPPSEAESRAYDALIKQLPAVSTTVPVVRATRVEQSGSAIAFLIQSPERLDWRRLNLQVFRAALATTTYTPIMTRVLRRADGAGLFIVSPAANASGSLLAQGEYRLVFTYRRDNRAIDAVSDLFSEAGNTAPEEAALNLPWQTQ